MNSKVWQAVQDRSEGLCEFPMGEGLCKCNYRVQQHHVLGKYNRKRLEMVETVYNLCDYHHLNPTTGVHFNKTNRLILEELVKEALKNKGWSQQRIAKELYGDSRSVKDGE